MASGAPLISIIRTCYSSVKQRLKKKNIIISIYLFLCFEKLKTKNWLLFK